MPDHAEETRIGLLDASPQRNVVLLHVDIVPSSQTVNGSVIELDIECGSTVVFNCIFDCSNGDDENQGHRAEAWIFTSEDGEELEEVGNGSADTKEERASNLTYHQDNEEKEKHVGNVLELEPQVFRNKA